MEGAQQQGQGGVAPENEESVLEEEERAVNQSVRVEEEEEETNEGVIVDAAAAAAAAVVAVGAVVDDDDANNGNDDNDTQEQQPAEEAASNLDSQWRDALAEMNEEELSSGGVEEEEEEEGSVVVEGEEGGPPLRRMGDPAPAPAASAAAVGPMVLTSEETARALEIKGAALNNPQLEPMTDYMYAQFAIRSLVVDSDDHNLGMVLEQIENYQQYLRDHNIQDTYAAACKALDKELRELVPDHYLSFACHPGLEREERSFVLALDLTTFDPTVMTDPRKHDIHLAATHFIMHAQNPDFDAIRRGVVTFYEMSGYDWRNSNMFNINCCKDIWEISSFYPLHVQTLRFYNTGMFTNLLMSMAKPVVSSTHFKAVEVGWKVGDDSSEGLLKDILVYPDLETTTERNLARIKMALQERYTNERNFQLLEP